jgi:signal transduction histidine kinase
MTVKDISFAVICVTIILLLFSGAILFFFLWYQKKKELDKKKIQEMEFEAHQLNIQYQQELLQSQLEIQEQTLKNISQEIHDNVGQVLSLAKLNLNMMDIKKPEQLEKKINSTLSQVTKAINDLRDLSKSFNTDNIVALGLIQSIAAEMDIINKADSHKTAFRITGSSVMLEPQKELILFRIVQEAMHNIIKHAQAKSLTVHADFSPAQLELTIYDDGKGFNLGPLNQENNKDHGLGIRNMHNRAKMIGADFSMSSTIGSGTMVKIVVPLEGQNTPAVT